MKPRAIALILLLGNVPEPDEESVKSELRKRMNDAMVLRGLAERTRQSYLCWVGGLAKYHRRAPDALDAGQVQSYLLHLISEKKLAVGAAQQPLYEALFGAVSATLTEFAASPRHLGGVAAFPLVLHTWTQDLRRHVHVHALVAGGALAPGGAWIVPKKGFLFPVRALSKVFRGNFVDALDDLRRSGRLPLGLDLEREWRRLKCQLYAHDWVVYAKQPLGGPQAVLDYLGHYTRRVAISNERILGIDGDEVLLRVRADATSGKKRTVRIPGTEFIGRFSSDVSCCAG